MVHVLKMVLNFKMAIDYATLSPGCFSRSGDEVDHFEFGVFDHFEDCKELLPALARNEPTSFEEFERKTSWMSREVVENFLRWTNYIFQFLNAKAGFSVELVVF